MGSNDWGMKLSKPGYDVNSTGLENQVFNSGQGLVRIIYAGNLTVNLTNVSVDTEGITRINIPVTASTGFTSDAAPLASTVINGKRFRANMATLSAGAIPSPNDAHYFSCRRSNFIQNDDGEFDAVELEFIVGRTTASSMNGIAESFNIRYFVVGWTQ